MKVSMMAALAGLAVCSAAFANPGTPVASMNGVEIKPVAMAKIMKVNGKIQLASDWVPYGQGFDSRGIGQLRFDCFGPDQNTDSDAPRAPVTSDTCIGAGLPNGSRWFFGGTYNLPHYAEDYSMDDGNATTGGVVSNMDYSWHMGNTGGNAYQSYIIVQFYSDHPADPDNECIALDNYVTGVIFDFGAVTSAGTFYFYSNLDGLETLNMDIPANGSYEVILAEEFDADAGTYTLPFSYNIQPMIYGTPEDRGEEGNGRQGAGTIDDDAPEDGTLDSDLECYSYSFGLCPEPLGRSMGIWIVGGSPCLVDWNGDGFVDFFDYDDYVNCFESGVCVGHDDADYNGDGFVDFFDYDDFVNAFENGC